MSFVSHIRVGPGAPVADAPQRTGQRCCARRWLRTSCAIALALAWLPRTSAAQSDVVAQSVEVAQIDAAGSASTVATSVTNPPLDFTLPAVTGGHWRLAEHRGRVVWLALVAPWCGQCATFVGAVVTRLNGADALSEAGAASVRDEPVFMVVSAVDARGNGLDVRLSNLPSTAASSAADDRSVSSAGSHAERTQLLIDRDGTVLRTFDPDELPWLVRIDENGVPVAAGTDLNLLAPARLAPGLWQNLKSRWRQLWGEQ